MAQVLPSHRGPPLTLLRSLLDRQAALGMVSCRFADNTQEERTVSPKLQARAELGIVCEVLYACSAAVLHARIAWCPKRGAAQTIKHSLRQLLNRRSWDRGWLESNLETSTLELPMLSACSLVWLFEVVACRAL